MDEILSGHKQTNCDGKWIEVGTLTNPGVQMCVKCRGRRMKPLVEPEESELEIEEFEMDEHATKPKYSGGMQMMAYMIIAATVSAAVTLLVLSHWKGATP